MPIDFFEITVVFGAVIVYVARANFSGVHCNPAVSFCLHFEKITFYKTFFSLYLFPIFRRSFCKFSSLSPFFK